MKIITWNLSNIRKNNAFAYALTRLGADIYFFQECFHPLTYLSKSDHKEMEDKYVWEPTENGWGNCIISNVGRLEPIDIESKFKGRILAAKLKHEVGEILLVDLHVPLTEGRTRHNQREMFAVIGPYIENKPAIIAGDLNFGEYFDRNRGTEHRDWLKNTMDQYYLISCFHKFHEKEKQTFRHPVKPAECMLDYIFVKKDMAQAVKTCDTIKNETIIVGSDHNPVYAEILG